MKMITGDDHKKKTLGKVSFVFYVFVIRFCFELYSQVFSLATELLEPKKDSSHLTILAFECEDSVWSSDSERIKALQCEFFDQQIFIRLLLLLSNLLFFSFSNLRSSLVLCAFRVISARRALCHQSLRFIRKPQDSTRVSAVCTCRQFRFVEVRLSRQHRNILLTLGVFQVRRPLVKCHAPWSSAQRLFVFLNYR